MFLYSLLNESRIHGDFKISSIIPSVSLTILIILFLGLRPTYGYFFGDSIYYMHSYNQYNDYVPIDWSQEWLWVNFSVFLKSLGFDVSQYFLVIETIYCGLMLATCIKLMRNNTWIAVLFCFASFSFYGYAINGLRNGMALSIIMYAIALFSDKNYERIIAALLMIIGLGIHRSTALASLSYIVAFFFIKEPKYAIGFWLLSIIISLFAGNTIGDFFASLGFDDRTSYFNEASESEYADQFSSTGFRFDFLLYSAMPILMTWYVTIKRNFQDKTFNTIAITYILANAFWIMVIRSSYSNRFAYLSWFLYPIVIAYPLLRMDIWKDQNKKIALILFLYAGFTFFMNFIYYAQ